MSSDLIWGSLIGFIPLILLCLSDYLIDESFDRIEIVTFVSVVIIISIPNLFYYANYLKNTIGKIYTIDLSSKSIKELIINTETLCDFNSIESIKQFRHYSYKPSVESKNFWDRLENRSKIKRLRTTVWHKFSYTIIFFKDRNPIILTSLMSNYNKLPFDNIETIYVKKPLIKR